MTLNLTLDIKSSVQQSGPAIRRLDSLCNNKFEFERNLHTLDKKVEKRDKRSGPKGEWYIAFHNVRHCQANVQDLIMGNEFEFRVAACNEVGLGPVNVTKDTAKITKQVITWEKPEYVSRLVSTAPEFTTEINHRNLTVGYNGVIHCAVKGFPKPTIKWYKNKLEIKGATHGDTRELRSHGI